MVTLTGCKDNSNNAWDYGGTNEGNNEFIVVAISDVISDPEKYKGNVLAVEGEISMVCPTAGCWIFIEDKGNSLFIQLYDFTVALANKTPVRILGEIRLRDGQPYLIARGLKVL